MNKSNRQYDKTMKLKSYLESNGWCIHETEFNFTDKIPVFTTIMKWDIQRSSEYESIKMEFIASQIGISTLADKNDIQEIIIRNSNIEFFYSNNETEWKQIIVNIGHELNKLQIKKTNT